MSQTYILIISGAGHLDVRLDTTFTQATSIHLAHLACQPGYGCFLGSDSDCGALLLDANLHDKFTYISHSYDTNNRLAARAGRLGNCSSHLCRESLFIFGAQRSVLSYNVTLPAKIHLELGL